VDSGLPSPTDPDQVPEGGWLKELTPIVAMAHSIWMQPAERRRLRSYGFRPAVEERVLKREWHGLTVRVGPTEIVARHPSYGELTFDADAEELRFDGDPSATSPKALETAEMLVSLINDYERWVEVREGRASRLRRTATTDRRPLNTIAETRRLQRMLGTAWGRPPTRRR
jgi:hypothetical protein